MPLLDRKSMRTGGAGPITPAAGGAARGTTPSLSSRQPLPEFRFRQHIQVCLDFFTELLVHPVLVEEVAAKAALPGNLEASRYYAQGLEKLRTFDPQTARDLFQKARVP